MLTSGFCTCVPAHTHIKRGCGGQSHSSEVGHLPSMCEVLGTISIPVITQEGPPNDMENPKAQTISSPFSHRQLTRQSSKDTSYLQMPLRAQCPGWCLGMNSRTLAGAAQRGFSFHNTCVGSDCISVLVCPHIKCLLHLFCCLWKRGWYMCVWSEGSLTVMWVLGSSSARQSPCGYIYLLNPPARSSP